MVYHIIEIATRHVYKIWRRKFGFQLGEVLAKENMVLNPEIIMV